MTNTFKEHLQRAILEIFISFLYHIISYHIILYYIIYHIIGNEGGGTPALQLPDGKGRRRGGENPAGGARGGRRCEGELRFFLQNANISSSSQSTRELWIGGRLHVHVPVFSREESESEKV